MTKQNGSMYCLPTLLVLALSLVLTRWGGLPPVPRTDTDPALGTFSVQKALKDLNRIESFGATHPVGTQAHGEVRDYLIRRFQEMGYSPEVQKTMVCRNGFGFLTCASVENIVAKLEGRKNDAILVTAHYDSVPAGPGIADDATGVAVVLQTAEALRQEKQPLNSVIFLISDAEEVGLLGARAFVRQHPLAEHVKVVLNMEARGTAGQSLMFETGPYNEAMVAAFSGVTRPAGNSALYELFKRMPNDTDLTEHKTLGIQALNFAFAANPLHYHTPLDDVKHLNRGSLQHQGDNILTLALKIADQDVSSKPRGDRVFFDLYSRLLVHYPMGWVLPLALLSIALSIVALFRILRSPHEEIQTKNLLWGFLAFPLALIAGLAGALLAITLLAHLLKSPMVGLAFPKPALVTMLSVSVGASALAYGLLRKRTGALGLWAGMLVWWNLLNLLVSLIAPGASYLFLWPAVGTALGLYIAGAANPNFQQTSWWLGLMVGVVPVAILWSRMLSFLVLLAGPMQLPVAVPALLILGSVIPLAALTYANQKTPRLLIALVFSVAVAGLFVTVRTPLTTVDQPFRASWTLYHDVDQGTFRWILPASAPKEMHATLREPTALDDDLGAAYQRAPQMAWSAPRVDLEAPAASLIEEAIDAAGNRQVTLRLKGSPTVFLLRVAFPGRLPISQFEVVGVEDFDPRTIEGTLNGGGLQFFGDLARDVKIKMTIPADQKLHIAVTDERLGLPPAGQFLLDARPRGIVPVQNGDVTVVRKSYTF